MGRRPEQMIDGRESFWRTEIPWLGIGSKMFSPMYFEEEEVLDAEEHMEVFGYFRGRLNGLEQTAPKLVEAVKRIALKEIPLPFLFLFDEVWECFSFFDPLLSSLLGSGYRLMPDFWVWRVGPGESGWAPHRDRGRKALAQDGSPLALTLWIPLTKADESSSCVFLLPKRVDRTYGTEREHEFDLTDPGVHTLRAAPGDYLCWNQAVLHWGSRAGPCPDGPRISMALEFQRGDIAPFDEPLIVPGAALTFDQRLTLVAKQLFQYRHMSPLDPETASWAHRTIHGDCELVH